MSNLDLLNKLESAKNRYDQVMVEISNPDTIKDAQKFKDLGREQKRLEPIVEKYTEYKALLDSEEEALMLLADKPDEDLKLLCDEQLKEAKEKIPQIEEEIKILLLPHDENDDRNVIVEIRAGAGGEEAALFASVLYRMYGMYADTVKYKIEPMNVNETGLGGYKEITFMVVGEGAYSRLKYESGVHRVQRVPETESQGRIHTSTVTVAVLPEIDDVEININPADLKIDTIKSSGAGGQHINKTESAIRIIHVPSGLVVECQEERSQHKNREKAMKLLATRLYDIEYEKQHEKIASERKSQVGTGDRSERIRTYNYPQGRVTDHRIGYTTHSLDSFLNGDIGDMLDALATADVVEKLKNSEQV